LEREAKSRTDGFFYIGSNKDSTNRITNGEILIISTIIKHVMSLTEEAEIGSVFLNAKKLTFLRTALEKMGHHQPPKPLQRTNTTATCYRNATIKQNRTREMDMYFYLVKDRVKQCQFHGYWGPGYQYLEDYFTKHHYTFE
jgi:hypothetical protein